MSQLDMKDGDVIDVMVDPESLAADLDRLMSRLKDETAQETRVETRDQLAALAARVQWVPEEQQRKFLEGKVDSLWNSLGADRE